MATHKSTEKRSGHEKVTIRGADGSEHLLAAVWETGCTVYVCPVARYREAASGCDDAVVGFPVSDMAIVYLTSEYRFRASLNAM
jgi:hypothetical protein